MRRRLLFLLAVPVLGAVLVLGYLRRHSSVQDETSAGSTGAAGHGMQRKGPALVSLDSATISRIGLHTTTLGLNRGAGEVTLTGEIVPDPQGTSTLRAPVAGRLAAVGQSWPVFGQQLQAGQEVAQVSDAKPLTVPRSGEVVRVLAQPGEQVAAGQEILVIADFEHPLARLAWREEAPAAPPRALALSRLGQKGRVTADLVGPAADADPVTRRPAYLYRVRAAWSDARPGTAVEGYVPSTGPSVPGVLVPSAGVVQWEGLAWVYVEQAPGKYLRAPVSTDRPVPGGWIESTGLKPGDRVVTQGAGQLLSEEFRAGITVGEEVEE
jgi:biotin carboxyl carrier protein